MVVVAVMVVVVVEPGGEVRCRRSTLYNGLQQDRRQTRRACS